MTYTTETVEQRARRLVDHEILTRMSSIINTMANHVYNTHGELLILCEQADYLCTPLPDYEECAIQNGWIPGKNGEWTRTLDSPEGGLYVVYSAEEACRYDIDPYEYPREIYEHWAVTPWLGELLTERGEKVGEFGDLTVWARTTTGQAITADEVILDIATDSLTR